MKITAEGARRSVYSHDIADEDIEAVNITTRGNIRFRIRSEQDPGIGAGLYDLTITLNKNEVLKLYEKAIIADQFIEMKSMKKKIRQLEKKLG